MTQHQAQAVSRCSGRRSKVRYADEYEAQRAADRLVERAQLFTYPCPLCDGFHLTSQQPDGRAPRPTAHQPRLHPCGLDETHGRHADCPGAVVVHPCTPAR